MFCSTHFNRTPNSTLYDLPIHEHLKDAAQSKAAIISSTHHHLIYCLSVEFNLTLRGQATLADRNLGHSGVDPTELHRLIVRELVHCGECDVEARLGVVDGKDIDRRSVVGELPTGATHVRVPASNRSSSADGGEVGQGLEVSEA